MQSNSRTFVSVVGTFAMVVLSVVAATWSPPHVEHPANGTASSQVARP